MTILALVLSLVLVLSLAACSSENKEEAGGEATTDAPADTNDTSIDKAAFDALLAEGITADDAEIEANCE